MANAITSPQQSTWSKTPSILKVMDAIGLPFGFTSWHSSSKSSQLHFNIHHRTALVFVTILAFVTRFWSLDYPSEVVFDEAHTMRFVSFYLRGRYFFDVHPPLGRLPYVLICKLMGYPGGFEPLDAGGSFVEHGVPYVALRSLPALLNSLTVPVVYLIMWESGCGIPACLVTAGLVVFDNAQITHNRLIYLDGIICFTITCSLLCYIKFTKAQNRPMSREWWTWLLLTGLALSCTVSVKLVGFFTYLTIGVYVLNDLWQLFNVKSGRAVSVSAFAKHVYARFICLLLLPFGLYLMWFKIHFGLLPRASKHMYYMTPEFQATLLRNSTSQAQELPFFRKWLELQGLMFEYTHSVTESHPYQSRPYQWPFTTRGVSFWCSDSKRQQIYFMGNIVGWWIASASVLLLSITILLDRLYRARGKNLFQHNFQPFAFKSGGFFLLTWGLHYFPWWLMNRQLMLHSYLPAQLASTMVTGSLLDLLDSIKVDEKTRVTVTAEKRVGDEVAEPENASESFSGSTKSAWVVCGAILLATFCFWCFYVPLTYGSPTLSMEAIRRREILGQRLFYTHEYDEPSCFG